MASAVKVPGYAALDVSLQSGSRRRSTPPPRR